MVSESHSKAFGYARNIFASLGLVGAIGAASYFTVGYTIKNPHYYETLKQITAAVPQAPASLNHENVTLPTFRYEQVNDREKLQELQSMFREGEVSYAADIDMDADGIEDTLVAVRNHYGGQSYSPMDVVHFFKVNGSDFKQMNQSLVMKERAKPDYAEFIDFNNDEKPDMVFHARDRLYQTKIYVKFDGSPPESARGSAYTDVDIDGDKRIDVISANPSLDTVYSMSLGRDGKFQRFAYPTSRALENGILSNINRNAGVIKNAPDNEKARLLSEFDGMYPAGLRNTYFQALAVKKGYRGDIQEVVEARSVIRNALSNPALTDSNIQDMVNNVLSNLPVEYRPFVFMDSDAGDQAFKMEAYQAAAAEATKTPLMFALSAGARGLNQALKENERVQYQKDVRKAYGLSENEFFSRGWDDGFREKIIMQKPTPWTGTEHDNYVTGRSTSSDASGSSTITTYSTSPRPAPETFEQRVDRDAGKAISDIQKGADDAGKAIQGALDGIFKPKR